MTLTPAKEFSDLMLEAANRLDLRPPTNTSKELLSELLSFLKALRECYQALHWQARGEPFYGDHLMYDRLYTAVLAEVDGLAEKAIGYTDDAFIVEATEQAARVSTHVMDIMSKLDEMTPLQAMFDAEKRFCGELLPKVLNSMEQAQELSDGMENFLQGLADEHEKNIYLIQRRLKTQKQLDEVEPTEPNISPMPELEDNGGDDKEFQDMEKEAEKIEEK